MELNIVALFADCIDMSVSDESGLRARLRLSASGTVEMDESATLELDDSGVLVLESDRLPKSQALDADGWRVAEYSCHFVPWHATDFHGLSWWKFSDAWFVLPAGLTPDEALKRIGAAEPLIIQLASLEQSRRWPVNEADEAVVTTAIDDAVDYMLLFDRLQVDPDRALVGHWARADFDAIVDTALTDPVLLGDWPSDPLQDKIFAGTLLQGAVARPRGQYFLYAGLIYTAPNEWTASEVSEWIQIQRGVAAGADPGDFSLPMVSEHLAATREKSYEHLAQQCAQNDEVVAFIADSSVGRERAGMLDRAEDEAPGQRDREAITQAVKTEVWRRDEAVCRYCGSQERLEFDHIIPVVKGGSSTARNIQLLCQDCNRGKAGSL